MEFPLSFPDYLPYILFLGRSWVCLSLHLIIFYQRAVTSQYIFWKRITKLKFFTASFVSETNYKAVLFPILIFSSNNEIIIREGLSCALMNWQADTARFRWPGNAGWKQVAKYWGLPEKVSFETNAYILPFNIHSKSKPHSKCDRGQHSQFLQR